MIVTITPNPAMDEGYTTREFRPGRWFHASDVNRSPGGRGINVSIILKQLGYDSVAMGFLAGHTGSYIRDDLLARGISTNFVNIKGENRTNTFIRDESSGIETALTDVGPKVYQDAQKRFFWNLERVLPRATAVQMGGSLPPGVPQDFFKEAIDMAKRKNIPIYIDSFGPPLDFAIEALPTVVKIDHRFMNTIRNISLSALDHLVDISKKIFDEGVDWIVTSYFNRSNLFCTTKGFFLAEIKTDRLFTFRSANDALIAGMIVAREERMGIEDTVRFAMSCVRRTIECPEKGLPSREAVESSIGSVALYKI
ncbi:MAG: PfkB family carbohydrate kinase [Synergistaceae bacterium]|jgi:1-phosphofructokinase family hexose kinase|nr:PfkB family carbohydrate kinase [Synergistaceae bacterium]